MKNQESENVTWLIGNNKVIFQRKKLSGRLFDVGDIYSIQKTEYPNMFESLDYNVIKVTPFNVGTKTFYLISNVFYQAAGYTLDYAIVVDIWAKKPVLYETNKYNVQGSFHNLSVLDNGDLKSWFIYSSYDFCRSCGYPLSEFLTYDAEKGFITHNTAYKEEYKKILAGMELNNHCAVVDGGKQFTFDEIKKQYGEDYQCRSSATTPIMLGITPKQYFELKDKVNRILNGEEISLLNNNL